MAQYRMNGTRRMARLNGDNESYSETETVARREAALQRAFATPHKPHRPIGKKRVESHGK
jgi:hypothetical protein